MATKKAPPKKATSKKNRVKKAAVKKKAAVSKAPIKEKPAKKKVATKKPAVTKKATPPKKAAAKTIKPVAEKSPGGIARIRHFDFTVNKPVKLDAKKIKSLVPAGITRGAAPGLSISFTMEPTEGDFIVFHPTPGFTSLEPPLAQLSIAAIVWNSGSKTVDLDKVVLEYKKGNQTIKQDVFLPADQLVIDPGYGWTWQNSRPYHEKGDVVFLDSPYPDKVTLSFYFKTFASTPVSATKNIKPYTQGLSLPFKASDFGTDEYVTGYSMHGGGDQVFAYDLGVQAYADNGWRDLLPPATDWGKNENYRIWGKPVYAMADGTVMHFESNIPNNWKPDGSDAGMKKQKDELWGSFDYGGSGNHFYIRHGNVVALYAHLQKGSLTSKFKKVGAVVKKGDLLGKAGNSGNSSGPHTHIHIKKYKNSDPESGAFRPLLFNNGYVIGQANYPKPKSNVNWSKLNNQGIPGLKSKACFVFPSGTHPYCAYPTNWGEVARHGVPENIYQQEFDKIWPCGYYPIWVDGYDVAGKTYFNMIFRPSAGVQWVARHNMDGDAYQAEFNTWSKAGYRLININSYLLSGKIRYAAVFTKQSGADWFAYHGQPLAWHESNFEKNWKAGWVPVNISCVTSAGKIFVSALWEKKNTGGFYAKPAMSLQGFQDAFNQFTNKEKFKLVYLDAYVLGGKPMLSGIWYKNAPSYNSWWEKPYLTAAQFQTQYTSMLGNGYLTRCIAGYADGGTARFDGIWSK